MYIKISDRMLSKLNVALNLIKCKFSSDTILDVDIN